MQARVPNFRELFVALTQCDGGNIWNDILSPWLRDHPDASCAPETFKFREAAVFLNDRPPELYNLYALSRISQMLILPFQNTGEAGYSGPRISHDQYVHFFESLGMEVVGNQPFSPYYHEIVEIHEVETNDKVKVLTTWWPGLRFGNMLFSRAGVSIQSPRGVFDSSLAETSTLYFAYKRLRRTCDDTSQGWGHNSQWNTIFRRCYEDSTSLYFNVDGEWQIGQEKSSQRIRWLPERQKLTALQRTEVLKFRCWVTQDGGECFPFWDQHVEAKQ